MSADDSGTRSPLVLQVSAMSVDGVITEEGTDAELLVDVDDSIRDNWMVASISQASVHIMGRRTYEAMASYWPTATGVFAGPMNTIAKVVFSKTLESAEWPESRIARGDTIDEINLLKRESTGPIVAHGGVRFAQSLVRLGVVDEYRLIVRPYLAGGGPLLFGRSDGPTSLGLAECVSFPSGALGLVYKR